ncbi:IS3 family transposase [Rhodocaloribacter sp.]
MKPSAEKSVPGCARRHGSLQQLCKAAGFSRQAYYQGRARREKRHHREARALEHVAALRAQLPRLGVRKIYHEAYHQFRELNLGRDALLRLLRRENLLVKRRRRYVSTTDSRHGFQGAGNLLFGRESGTRYRPRRPNEVFVADITYVETLAGFRYAALITDAFSRKIVGYDLSASLSVEGSLRALEQALGQTTKAERKGLIHHSDRGVQYCCRAYRERLARAGVRVSMSATGNPYENALAERVHGILKQELGLDAVFVDERQARRALREAVRLYNDRRPHLALDYCKPSQVHARYRQAA